MKLTPATLIVEALEDLPALMAGQGFEWMSLAENLAPLELEAPYPLLVYPQDLWRMSEMALSHLPLDAVALPYTLASVSPATLPAEAESGTGPVFNPVCLKGQLRLQQAVDVSRHLSAFFPTKFVAMLYELQSLFRRFHLEGYLIGGIARDLILGQAQPLNSLNFNKMVQDIDITVVGNAIDCAEKLARHSRNIEVLETYEEFGTAKVLYKDLITLDLASTREERYPFCGALPQVTQRGVPLEIDLVRRDFSINTLALSIHDLGQLLDFTGGLNDVESGKLRVLHGASFFEDPSRIVRAYKFASRLNFALTAGTQRLADRFLRYADETAYKGGGSRIRTGLWDWLTLNEVPIKHHWVEHWLHHHGYRLLCRLNELASPPDLAQLEAWLQCLYKRWPLAQEMFGPFWQAEGLSEATGLWQVYLCLLVGCLNHPKDRHHLEERLELPRQEKEAVDSFLRLLRPEVLGALNETTQAIKVYQALQHRQFSGVLAACLIHPDYEAALRALQAYKHRFEKVAPELDGRDLLALGVPEGKAVGQLLERLLDQRLQGLINSKEDELAYVEWWVKTAQSDPKNNQNDEASL